MRWFRFAVLVLIAAVAQAGFLTNLNIKPDLLLILLVFFAIYCDPTDVIISSFALGFIADIISMSMGPRMISFGLYGTLLAYLRRVITIGNMPYQAIAIFITGMLVGYTAYLLHFLKSEPVTPTSLKIILGVSISSGIVGPFLFLPSAWWMQIKTARQKRRRL